MTDITELAQRMKAAAVRAKTATEEYASGHMSVSVCYAECEEFNRLTDGPDNILALVEALEKSEKTSEARREAIDITHKRAARERDRANAAEEALEKAQQRIEELEHDLSEWTDCKHDGATYYDMSGQERCGRCGADV